jgi:pimeloyl-ACP methyl ester carboxylesterase
MARADVDKLEIAGIPVAYLDEGSGPPVILAHCSSASHRMWGALIRELAGSHRVLAPDLIGYGQSGPWPQGRPYEADADARVLAALARKAGGSVHFVGHSYGAAMALEAARMLGGAEVRGMTLIEPVAFHLLKAAGRDAAYREVEAVARGTIAAMADGDRRRASAVYMGFWLGRLRWWLAPKKLKAPVMETVDKVALEFAAIEAQTVESLAPYQALRVSTLLLYGAKTRRPAKAVVEVLSETLPLSRAQAIPAAGHMSPFTHRDAVNALLLAHIREAAYVG